MQFSAYLRELLDRQDVTLANTAAYLNQFDGIVLAGAGRVGQEFLEALRDLSPPVLAFTDNDEKKWGKRIAGVTVYPPTDAAIRFGRNCLFIVTAGRLGQQAKNLVSQYTEAGANRVIHFPEAIRFFQGLWPTYFLDPRAFSVHDAQQICSAYDLLADEPSKATFVGHLTWRILLDPSLLPTPDYDNQYFPRSLIQPGHCAVFVDVGAYVGDTLVAASKFAGSSLKKYYGYEPDSRNFAMLAKEAVLLSTRDDLHIEIENIAIGSTTKKIAFTNDGLVTSRAINTSAFEVSCKPLDNMGLCGPTYVKIDTEGFEAEVLRGGDHSLRQYKPLLAVAIYHRPRDLFELPLWLKEFAADYRLYLRSHGDAGIDLVCYAIREA